MRGGRQIRWFYRLAVAAGALPILAAALAAGYYVSPWSRDRAQLRERAHKLSGLALACRLYAGDHGGTMPPDLPALFPVYVNSPVYLAYATNEVDYFPGGTEQTNPTVVLMREKRPDKRGRRWEEHQDCSIALLRSTPASSPLP